MSDLQRMIVSNQHDEPRQAIDNPTTRRLRFSLTSLLLLMIPAAFLSQRAWEYYSGLPPDWRPYSDSELDKSLADGRPAVVVMGSAWDVNTALLWRILLNDPEVCRAIRSGGHTPLVADLTNSGEPSWQAAKRLTNGKAITGVVFVVDPSEPNSPRVLDFPIDRKTELLDALR